MLEIGKLYACKEYYLMIYPDQETAYAEHAATDRAADFTAAFWSKRFGKPVLFSEKNIPLLILNNKEKYIEVLAGEKKGWIIYEDFLNIKEIE
jgi:hypothetical protein